MKMQTKKLFITIVSFLLYAPLFLSSPVPDPESVVEEVHKSINASVAGRRKLGYLSCTTGNPIDDCWRCDPHWEQHRQRLADCAIGFGKNAIGGRDGRIYVVTDSGNDNPVSPKPGTLRHAVIQDEPLWIIFQRDMTIQLKEELIMNSFKTIDGRGASVHISGGPCITIQYVTNIIIHGIHIHDCKQGGNAMVRSSPRHFGWRTISDGDGVSIFGGSHVWVDHCSFSNCEDGLIDAIMGSTAITLSNNHMTHHDKVMLLGHSDTYSRDKNMQVTIAFNHFGEGLVQRMPRCRHGYFHVVNNDYTHWEMYAIGGSANPTINSQGNRFLAPNIRFSKEVTKHEDAPESEWKRWNWRSSGDLLLNGAFFTPSGGAASSSYAKASSLGAKPSSLVGPLTSTSGALNCPMASSIVTSSLKPLAMADSSSSTIFSHPSISSSISSSRIRCSNTSDWAEEGGEGSVAVEENEDSFESQDGEADVSEGADFPEPSEEAKLFVGNLAYDVDSQALAMLFEQAGTVEIAEVIYNRETDQSRGFGFVTMSTVEEAETAVEKFNRYDLNGRLLTVNKAAPRGSRPERAPRVYEPAFRVYVGNLPWDVDNGRLEQVFSEHGKVVEARVVYDRETGRSRGFGFVTMSNENELNDAIAALDGQNMEGRAIRVNVAEERPRRMSTVVWFTMDGLRSWRLLVYLAFFALFIGHHGPSSVVAYQTDVEAFE
ncbi:unnamed protein product [Arabidopsis arenosa]|uniref:Pectate lyase n=1 Tax=Arabidopsis arenosa TaxID=38785 RepID=A0A8S2B283_ARAAE|nr:unnamed protein product [Arabidopsis arenosa]